MRTALLIALGIIFLHSSVALATGGGGGHGADINFPPSLASYEDGHLDGIGLVKAALLPTVIMALCFWLLRF